MAVGIDDHANASGNGYATNSGDKCGRLSSYRADANCVGLAGNTCIADVDIVIACGKFEPAEAPNAMLSLPVVLFMSAFSPMAVLLLPVWLL